MPLYLVRWPDLSAALVTAANEDDLIDVLDEVANPEGATWTPYRGPLFLDFELPVTFSVKERPPGEPLSPDHLEIGDVAALAHREWPRVKVADADAGSEMVDRIYQFAFPHLHAARVEAEDEELDHDAVREALKKDLDVLVRASWRRQNTKRSKDPIAQLAAKMDAPPRLVRKLDRSREENRIAAPA